MVAVAAVVVALGGACTTSPSPTSSDVAEASTTTSSTTTTVRGAPHQRIVEGPRIEWGPDFDPDAATLAEINEVLDEFEIWMLWPQVPPSDVAATPIEGKLRVRRIIPGGTDVRLWVDTPDWNFAWASWDAPREVCPGPYAPLMVRGNAGCIDHPDNGRLLLEWTERDRNMAIDAWGLDEDTLLAWLATWQELPNP